MTPEIVVEKVIEDGMVAVLYSPRYGAGWSTWASSYDDGDVPTDEFLMFDRHLVEMVERNATRKEVDEFLESLGIQTYTGGWDDIQIAWVSVGEKFQITEYDGSETIRYYNSKEYFTA